MTWARKESGKRSLQDVVGIASTTWRGYSTEASPKLHSPIETSLTPASCQVVCVASGKGGTGKTVVTTNLATLLARTGLKVLLLDADLGLANAHLLLGVSPQYDIASVLSGEKTLQEIVVACGQGLQLVPGGSGFSELAEIKDGPFRFLAREFKNMEKEVDVILVDLSAGISPQVIRFLNAAHEIILVTTPDITSLIDAYATIKSLVRFQPNCVVKLIMNRARHLEEALAAFQKLKRIVAKHLKSPHLSYFGWLPHNFYIQNSVASRKPVVLLHPMSFVTKSLQKMATKIKVNHQGWMRQQMGDSRCAVSFFGKLEQSVYD